MAHEDIPENAPERMLLFRLHANIFIIPHFSVRQTALGQQVIRRALWQPVLGALTRLLVHLRLRA